MFCFSLLLGITNVLLFLAGLEKGVYNYLCCSMLIPKSYEENQ